MIFEKERTRNNGKTVRATAEGLNNGHLKLTVTSNGIDKVIVLDPFELDVGLKAIGGLSLKGWKGLNG